jgi:hypothetical protein
MGMFTKSLRLRNASMAGKRKAISPVTGEPLANKKLLPAPQAKGIIEVSVASGYIRDKVAQEWLYALYAKEEDGYLDWLQEEGDVYVTGKELWNLFNPSHITQRGYDNGMYPKQPW